LAVGIWRFPNAVFVFVVVILFNLHLYSLNVYAAILIDGDKSDWKYIPVFIQEQSGDVKKITKVIQDYGTQDEREIYHYNYDVVSIKMDADNQYVYMLIELADDVGYYLEKHKQNDNIGDNICFITLDIDNDVNTGNPEGVGYWTKGAGGFEVQIAISEGSVIGVEDSEFISYSVETYNEESKMFAYDFKNFGFENHAKDTRNNTEDIAYKGRFIELRIPQEIVKIKEGQEVRAILYEPADSPQSWKGNKPQTEYSDEFVMQIW
jgi:hypothetical protein